MILTGLFILACFGGAIWLMYDTVRLDRESDKLDEFIKKIDSRHEDSQP